MSNDDSYPSSRNPFGSEAGSRGPGSELDHPGGSLYMSLPASGADDFDDLPPPPPEWLAPVYLPPPPSRHVTPNVILPPFRVKRPAAWFRQCEDIFRMRGVTDQRDMFALCYGMLGNDQFELVDDIAEACPRPPDAFFRLRDRLVASHSLDVNQRVEQLLALPPLGGQRPSALLGRMRQLCPQGEESGVIFRQLFLQRLPAQIRLQLAEDRFSPLPRLAERADTLMAHYAAESVAAVPSQLEQTDATVAAVQGGKRPEWRDAKKKKAPHGGRGQAAGSKNHPWDALGICRSHYKFGEDCFKCGDPATCKWASGN